MLFIIIILLLYFNVENLDVYIHEYAFGQMAEACAVPPVNSVTHQDTLLRREKEYIDA